jgi:hypothetical protein|tara:strand:+ start:70431 stop:70898 length:468 start_codon:yes stop_codon:yes gene_type:complete
MKLAKKSKAFLVLLLLISFTTVSVASEPTVTKLKKGDKVPFQAWCFNIPAAAKLIADKESEQERCQLEISKELEKQKADFDLRIGSLAVDLEYHKELSEKTIAALQVENQKLEQIALDRPNDYWYLWFGGGIAATLIVYYVGSTIANAVALSTLN